MASPHDCNNANSCPSEVPAWAQQLMAVFRQHQDSTAAALQQHLDSTAALFQQHQKSTDAAFEKQRAHFASEMHVFESKLDDNFGAFKTDVINDLTKCFEAETAQLGGKFDQLRDETREGFARMEAEVFNEKVRRKNAFSMNYMGFNPRPLRSIRKVNAGQGCPLPRQDPVPELPEPRVGELVSSAHFPATIEALRQWSHLQINVLSILLNDSFSIQPCDDITTRRHRVLVFLTE